MAKSDLELFEKRWKSIFHSFLNASRPGHFALRVSAAAVCVDDGTGIASALALLSLSVEPPPSRFSTAELVEMLKEPLCVGPARRAVLDQLENRYRCKFAYQWDFVRFAQEQNLEQREGFVLAGPPKRLAENPR
jgi:hypothetical protein